LIGPGTGVAPFRGFLQERRARIQQERYSSNKDITSVGECWLFFGCRRPDLDYLYESDLKSFHQDGTLTRLEVAFSRAPPQQIQDENEPEKKEIKKKVYVQDMMAQHSVELYNLFIEKEGTVFVCGDGATMAKDVHATLITILSTGGEITEAAAADQLSALAKEGRYVRDIWS
jgi:NADPH-ferrihemoprotein reductase